MNTYLRGLERREALQDTGKLRERSATFVNELEEGFPSASLTCASLSPCSPPMESSPIHRRDY